MFNIISIFQKWAKQFLICTVQGSNNFLSFCLVFSLKQAKEQILFQVQPLQMFKGNRQNCLMPWDMRKGIITCHEILELARHRKCIIVHQNHTIVLYGNSSLRLSPILIF